MFEIINTALLHTTTSIKGIEPKLTNFHSSTEYTPNCTLSKPQNTRFVTRIARIFLIWSSNATHAAPVENSVGVSDIEEDSTGGWVTRRLCDVAFQVGEAKET